MLYKDHERIPKGEFALLTIGSILGAIVLLGGIRLLLAIGLAYNF